MTHRPLRLGLLSAWSSRAGGGVFEAVVTLAEAMARSGAIEPMVFAAHDGFTESDRPRFGAVPLVTRPVAGPRFFGYARGLLDDVLAAEVDVLHLHGIWLYPSALGAAWAARTGRPYVVSPHGMLAPWILARGRWKKALARLGYERRSWRRAAAFHALTAAEAGEIAAAAPGARVAVIPNAVAPAATRAGPDPAPDVVYLGRIHPKKNLDALLGAWQLLRARGATAGRSLRIAGWGEPGHVAALEARLAALADPSIAFVGPVFGAAKADVLASAACLVLPSLSEGLPMAVLEAWAAGVPTVMSDACNLPEGFAAGAALRCGLSAEAVAAALGDMLALPPPAWREMSAAACRLASGPFAPARVEADWLSLYHDLAGAHRAGPAAMVRG